MKHNIISLRPVAFGVLTLLTLVWVAVHHCTLLPPRRLVEKVVKYFLKNFFHQ